MVIFISMEMYILKSKPDSIIPSERSNIEKFIVPFDIAYNLKNVGFNEDCLTNYNHKKLVNIFLDDDYMGSVSNLEYTNHNDYVAAPTYDQVLDWFNVNHNIEIVAFCNGLRSHLCRVVEFFDNGSTGTNLLPGTYSDRTLTLCAGIEFAIDKIKKR